MVALHYSRVWGCVWPQRFLSALFDIIFWLREHFYPIDTCCITMPLEYRTMGISVRQKPVEHRENKCKFFFGLLDIIFGFYDPFYRFISNFKSVANSVIFYELSWEHVQFWMQIDITREFGAFCLTPKIFSSFRYHFRILWPFLPLDTQIQVSSYLRDIFTNFLGNLCNFGGQSS